MGSMPRRRKSKLEKCVECGKTVYAMERIKALDKIFHASCFKCTHCSTKLNLQTYHDGKGDQYCKNCYATIFGADSHYGGLLHSKTAKTVDKSKPRGKALSKPTNGLQSSKS